MPSVGQRIGHIQKSLKSVDAAPVAVADVNEIGLHIVEARPILERLWLLDVAALNCDPEYLGSWERGNIVQKQRHVGVDLLQFDHEIERVLQRVAGLVGIADHEEQVLIDTVLRQAADRFQSRFDRSLVRDARKKFVRSGFSPDCNLHESGLFQPREQIVIHLCHPTAYRCRDPAKTRWHLSAYERIAKFDEAPPPEKEITVIEQDSIGPVTQPVLDVVEHPFDRESDPAIFRIKTEVASKRTAAAENRARLPVAINSLEHVPFRFDQIIGWGRIVVDVFEWTIGRRDDLS